MLEDNACTGRPAAGTSTGEITDEAMAGDFGMEPSCLIGRYAVAAIEASGNAGIQPCRGPIPGQAPRANLNSMFKTRNVAESSRNPIYSSLYRTFGCLNERTLKRDQLQEALFSESYPGSEPPISRDVSLSLKMHIPLCHDHPCSRSTSRTVQMG